MTDMVEFFAVPGGESLGVVEFLNDGDLVADPPSLADVVMPVWLRLLRDPEKAAAFYAGWSNGSLRSQTVQPDPDSNK